MFQSATLHLASAHTRTNTNPLECMLLLLPVSVCAHLCVHTRTSVRFCAVHTDSIPSIKITPDILACVQTSSTSISPEVAALAITPTYTRIPCDSMRAHTRTRTRGRRAPPHYSAFSRTAFCRRCIFGCKKIRSRRRTVAAQTAAHTHSLAHCRHATLCYTYTRLCYAQCVLVVRSNAEKHLSIQLD